MSSNHYDVVIIGTGAGGGTLALKLAPTGKKILMLERGDYVPREKDNWSSAAVGPDGVGLPSLGISEAGYLSIPHKNKYGQEYPPDSDSQGTYPGKK